MIVTLGGPPGSGTSTLAKILKESLQLSYEYAGAVFRQTAKDLKMTLVEFGQYAVEHPEIDKDLDDKMIAYAKDGQCLLEGRMIGALVHKNKINAFKIWLTASIETRAKRLETRDNLDYETSIKKNKQRDECDRQRYLSIYNIDPNISTCYDLNLNSDELSPEQLAEIVIQNINNQNKKENTNE
ncbi:MAG: cytidylate kinase [Planctomycetota bacterium]|nr:MAG: cytidylate kinase [Planctomycetota bacterium]